MQEIQKASFDASERRPNIYLGGYRRLAPKIRKNLDHFFAPKIPNIIKFNDFIQMATDKFEVRVFGFRELHSIGFSPVKKAFV